MKLFIALALALTFLACEEKAKKTQVDVLTWPRMSVDKFGCMMEKTFGYRHERFNCSMTRYENNENQCSNPDKYYEGFPFPDSLVKKVHPLLSRISLDWEHGELQDIYLQFNSGLTEEQMLNAFGLSSRENKPDNIMSIEVGEDYLRLTGFDPASSYGDCNEEMQGDSEEEPCPDTTGPLQTIEEAAFLEASENAEGLSTFAFRLVDGNEMIFNIDDELVKNLKKGDKVSITYEDVQTPFDTQCWNLKRVKSLSKLQNNETNATAARIMVAAIGSEKIAITTAVAVKDFNFIELGYDDNLFVKNTPHSLEELSPEKPFIVNCTIGGGGGIPNWGISYTDENNAKRYFSISENGVNGRYKLSEFHPKTKGENQ
jgi:hypothetical protein